MTLGRGPLDRGHHHSGLREVHRPLDTSCLVQTGGTSTPPRVRVRRHANRMGPSGDPERTKPVFLPPTFIHQ